MVSFESKQKIFVLFCLSNNKLTLKEKVCVRESLEDSHNHGVKGSAKQRVLVLKASRQDHFNEEFLNNRE